MRWQKFFVMWFTFAIIFAVHHTSIHADDGIPGNCENPNSPYNNLFPRYTANDPNHDVVLIDWTSGEEVSHLEGVLTAPYEFSWSPNCRYLVGIQLGVENTLNYQSGLYNHDDPGIVAWDITTGRQNLAIYEPVTNHYVDFNRSWVPKGRLLWRPDDSAAIITPWITWQRYLGATINPRSTYSKIWNPLTGDQITLKMTPLESAFSSTTHQPNMLQLYWDDARRWLWSSGGGGITVFNMDTGEEVTAFLNPPWVEYWGDVPPSRFVFSPDGSKVIVYTIAEHGSSGAAVVTIWDIASMTSTAVPMGDIAAPYITSGDNHPVALSPDNRYLAVGYDAIRVWDLTQLDPTCENRQPTYRYGGPEEVISNLHFVDHTTLETRSADGTQHWNILTGEFVPEP